MRSKRLTRPRQSWTLDVRTTTRAYPLTSKTDLATAVDSWYAEAIGFGVNRGFHCGEPTPGIISVEQSIRERFGTVNSLAARSGLARGLYWFIATRKNDRIVCPLASRGLLAFLILETMFGRSRRRVYLVEFLRPVPNSLKDKLKEAIHVRLCRWLFRHTLAGAQVMTKWEVESYAKRYRLPQSRFEFISLPMMMNPTHLSPISAAPNLTVLASGRAACDWHTLFDASRGSDWHLVVVCAKEDRAIVDKLNFDGRATVMSEISGDEHQRLLLNASVYALVLREINASSGQVRFARAIEAGIPVVASAVRGLDGYLVNEITGLAVPVGDATALRIAIDRLIKDATVHNSLRLSAYEEMRPRNLTTYISEIKRFCLSAEGGGLA